MSSVIVSNIIHNAVYFHSPDFIKTEKWFNKNIADTKLTNKLITDTFNSTKWDVAVTGGFISTDRDSGEITNLGRGGSDYTAAIIAAALDASILEIWTDVDGFMTADPRIIPQANVMSHISFIESMELCSFGAKVIYPPTIYPVFHKNIPIKILNTFNPTAPGTLIDDKSDNSTTGAKGISAIRNTTLIQIVGSHTQNVAEINSRTFNAMAKNGISVYLVTPPAEEAGFAFAVSSNDADKAIKCLNDEFSPELAAKSITSITSEKGLATVAIVGENIGSIAGIGPRIFNSLQRSSIQVLAYSDGTSSTTISFVIHENKVNEALKLIHASFFE
jgi:aspartokinase/homoserine dehydrogenase 1